MSCLHLTAHGHPIELYFCSLLLSKCFWLVSGNPEPLLIWMSLAICCAWEAEPPQLGKCSLSHAGPFPASSLNTSAHRDFLSPSRTISWQQVCLCTADCCTSHPVWRRQCSLEPCLQSRCEFASSCLLQHRDWSWAGTGGSLLQATKQLSDEIAPL